MQKVPAQFAAGAAVFASRALWECVVEAGRRVDEFHLDYASSGVVYHRYMPSPRRTGPLGKARLVKRFCFKVQLFTKTFHKNIDLAQPGGEER